MISVFAVWFLKIFGVLAGVLAAGMVFANAMGPMGGFAAKSWGIIRYPLITLAVTFIILKLGNMALAKIFSAHSLTKAVYISHFVIPFAISFVVVCVIFFLILVFAAKG